MTSATGAQNSPSHQRVVLITGCSSGGIGHYLALAFAARGFKVYASARNPGKISPLLESRGISSVQMDVMSDDSVNAAVNEVLRLAGCIDIVVNNAGQICVGPVVEVSAESAKEVFDVNFLGVARVCRAVVPHMMDRRSGAVVNIGSVSGYMTTPWVGYYAASKAAVHMLSDALRMEVEPFGVKVLVVAPGSVKSHLVDAQRQQASLLSEDSRYRLAEDAVRARTQLSQREDPMDTEAFARRVVDLVVDGCSARYATFGGNALAAWIAYFVPPRLRDYYLARRFGTRKLKADLLAEDSATVAGVCPASHKAGARCPLGY
ncbi:hypothetical protein LPJ75_007338 [Coemansia sp. RSA 2598]|nr:hypothetical protein LPJ75_007338 [Coemansia sp. RSA 2598]